MPAGKLTYVSPPTSDEETTETNKVFDSLDAERPKLKPFGPEPPPPSSDDDTSDEETWLKRERVLIAKYLKETKPLTYDEVMATMNKAAEQQPMFARDIQMWLCEYGEWNHEMCKEIRANILDRDKVKEIGKRIHDRGGFTALQANFYILKNWLCDGPLRAECTQYMFHGIGEWQA